MSSIVLAFFVFVIFYARTYSEDMQNTEQTIINESFTNPTPDQPLFKQNEDLPAETLENSLTDSQQSTANFDMSYSELTQRGPEKHEIPASLDINPAVIPTQYPLVRYESLWKRSPFVLSTATVPSTEPLAQKYSLGGFAIINNEPYITVIETATQRRFLVSKNPTKEHSITLVSINESPKKPIESSAVISINGAQQTITFDKNTLAMTGPGLISQPQQLNNPAGFPTFPNQQQFFQQTPQAQIQNFPQNTQFSQGGIPIPQPFSGSTQIIPNPQSPIQTPENITPPEVPQSTRRIIRRRIVDDPNNQAQPMAIPPNSIPNPPPQ